MRPVGNRCKIGQSDNQSTEHSSSMSVHQDTAEQQPVNRSNVANTSTTGQQAGAGEDITSKLDLLLTKMNQLEQKNEQLQDAEKNHLENVSQNKAHQGGASIHKLGANEKKKE